MSSPPPTPPPDDSPTKAPASFLRVVGVVLSSFLGIRKRAQSDRDALTIKPMHVIIAGVLGAAVFVAVLVTLVRFITRNT